MKFKEIKPGMVIHCPEEEDARALLKHLKEKEGYEDCNMPSLLHKFYRICDNKYLSWYENPDRSRMTITEFSDLIETDDISDWYEEMKSDSPINSDTDSPMTAVEALEWFRENYHSSITMSDVFDGSVGLSEILNRYTVEEIVDKITAYEAAKKAPKPVELKWVKLFRVIQIQDSGVKKCVYEEEVNPNVAYGTGEKGSYSFDPKYGAENVLKDYISKHEGRYIAVIEDVCRERLEGES